MTLFLKTLLALCLFVLGAGVAQAQCAPGMIPYSGTDINSCGPDPNYNQQQAPRRNPYLDYDPNAAILAHGWSALVTDNEKMAVSTVQGKKSRQEAIATGMAECKSKGGTNCKLLSAVHVR